MAMILGLLKLGLVQEHRLGTFWQLGSWAPKLSQTAKSWWMQAGCRLAKPHLPRREKRLGRGRLSPLPSQIVMVMLIMMIMMTESTHSRRGHEGTGLGLHLPDR